MTRKTRRRFPEFASHPLSFPAVGLGRGAQPKTDQARAGNDSCNHAGFGAVANSSRINQANAAGASAPHISTDGINCPQTAGRSGRPKMRQALDSSSCTQRTPAALPFGMPGICELMDGAMQQAPQPGRQFMKICYKKRSSLPIFDVGCRLIRSFSHSGGGLRPRPGQSPPARFSRALG